MTTDVIGAAIKRREDPRFITGAGNYLADIKLPGLVHAAVLRSPYAHARITSIDTTAAKARPGVLAVFTGQDFADVNPLPCAWAAGGVENHLNTPRILAIETVRWTGDGIAMVVAETEEQATDALESINVKYAPLPV